MINQSEISVKPTRSSSATDLSDYINKAKTASEFYINKLWNSIDSRLDYTDTSFCTSFSEAPAVSVLYL